MAASEGEPPVILSEGLGFAYPHHGADKERLQGDILQDVTFRVEKGEIVIVTGPSGSGKTTLLTLIGGLRKAYRGHLSVLGHELVGHPFPQALHHAIGYIFQHHNLRASLTAMQNVCLPLYLMPSISQEERDFLAKKILVALGLESVLLSHPAHLSGGQRQRVAIARALVHRPKIILADEPTASLDAASIGLVMEVLHTQAKQEGTAMMVITHDARLMEYADRYFMLKDGILEETTTLK
jgi:putative ABC transport system ATP-binding protein